MDDFPAPQFPHKMSTSGALSLVAIRVVAPSTRYPGAPCWQSLICLGWLQEHGGERCACIEPHVCVNQGGKAPRLSRLSTWQAVGGTRQQASKGRGRSTMRPTRGGQHGPMAPQGLG